MGAAILFQKSYVVSNGKPTLPPAIQRKHWPVCSRCCCIIALIYHDMYHIGWQPYRPSPTKHKKIFRPTDRIFFGMLRGNMGNFFLGLRIKWLLALSSQKLHVPNHTKSIKPLGYLALKLYRLALTETKLCAVVLPLSCLWSTQTILCSNGKAAW